MEMIDIQKIISLVENEADSVEHRTGNDIRANYLRNVLIPKILLLNETKE